MRIDFGKLHDAEMVHPLEYEAARACQSNPVFEWLSAEAARVKMSLLSLPEAAAQFYPVNRYTSPRLYRLYRTALARLHCEEEYPLFIANRYDLTASTVGSNSEGCMILINNACLERLDDGELLALLGREIGHIRADHIQYTELLGLLEGSAKRIPVLGTVLGKKIWAYFAQWLIASEFTADRAAVFAAQSASAVESLLMKQIGVDPASAQAERLRAQEVPLRTERLGVYFIRQSRSMPCFGNVERIAELRRWVRSAEMRRDHPQVYFTTLAEWNDLPDTMEDEGLVRLHAAALNRDAQAAGQLADMYIRGEGTLPVSTSAARSLCWFAATNGNPMAMWYLISFMRHGLEGMQPDDRRIEQLYRAAYSRGLRTKRGNPYPQLRENPEAARLAEALRRKYGLAERPAGEAARLKDAFCVPREAEIYMAEASLDSDGQYYGLAVASSGLYGRIDDRELPFMVKWDEFEKAALTAREDDEGWWLFTGKNRLMRKPKRMQGTVAELVLRLKKGMES